MQTNYYSNKIQRQEALIKTSELLNSTQDTSYILRELLNQSLKYIKGGDAGIIFLYNEKKGLLEVHTYIGFDKEVETVTLKPYESITGLSFAKKEPLLFSNQNELQAVFTTMNKENRDKIKNTYENVFPQIHSTISCPLVFRDKGIGVIVIDNFTEDNPLTSEDLDFLKVISIQAAIAVNNAINYEKEIQNNKHLQYSTNLHNKFTSMVLDGSTIQDITQELSRLLKKDVILIDHLFFNINNYVLNKSLSDKRIKMLRSQLSDKVDNLKSTIYKIPNSEYNLYLYPIIVNKEALGWLGVISVTPLASEIDNITLERGTTTLALEMLKTREIQEIELKLKGDFLDNLVENQDKDYLLKCCDYYGYNVNQAHQIIVMELKTYHENESNVYDIEFINLQKKMYEYFSRKFNKYFPHTISIIKGHNIIFILELNKVSKINLSRQTLEQLLLASKVKYNISHNNYSYYFGISNKFSDISQFKASYNNAFQALKIGKNTTEDSFLYFYDELEIKKFLLNNKPEDLQGFLKKTLGNLLNYNKNSRQEFLNTLNLYIKSNGNWSYTKDKLLIHGNTLNYRLKRIEEILNIDLNNYNHRLKIQIALEILEIE